jgi:hypothetical protein
MCVLCRECGDVFSSHVIDNPDVDSEKALLRSYAPSLSEDVLSALTASFSDLRDLNGQGVLTYPYSTRELVAVAKVHISELQQRSLHYLMQHVVMVKLIV